MNIWIFLWLIIAIIILGSTSWAYLLVFRQKQVWASYAKKYALVFTKGSLLSPPQVRGIIKGDLTLTLYTEEQVTPDGRNQRYRNVVLIEAPWGIAGGGAIAAAPPLKLFISQLKLKDELALDGQNWPSGTLFRSQNKDLLAPWMTPERVKVIQALLVIKNADPLIIFDDKTLFIRLETADPLVDEVKLDKLVQKLVMIVGTLKPGETSADNTPVATTSTAAPPPEDIKPPVAPLPDEQAKPAEEAPAGSVILEDKPPEGSQP